MSRRLLAALAIALCVGSATPSPIRAQLRPDRDALAKATELKAKRASAPAVAAELQKMRKSTAQITAVLNAVGYRPKDIGEVHQRTFRMDARTSARTTMEALRDVSVAFQVMVVMTKDSNEAMRAARSDLRMSATATLKSLAATGMIRKSASSQAYSGLTRAGFTSPEVVAALADEFGATPGEVYDWMLAQGSSLTEIAQELVSGMGQSVSQVVALFAQKDAPAPAAVDALDAIGATTAQIVKWTLREAIAGTQVGSAYYTNAAQILAGRIGSVSEVIDALADEGVGAPVLVIVGTLLVIAQEGTLTSAAAVERIADMAAAVAGAGYGLAEIAGELHANGIAGDVIGDVLFRTGASASAVWGAMHEGLGWSANQLESALSEVLPVTISFLAEFVGLGGVGGRVAQIVGRLRLAGESAVSIALEVGSELGMVPMATALWSGGYGAGEVTNALMNGMNATAAQAGQVVAGLTGG